MKPFDPKVERLSLFGDQSHVAHLPVQTARPPVIDCLQKAQVKSPPASGNSGFPV
jgi:hypothetical protein